MYPISSLESSLAPGPAHQEHAGSMVLACRGETPGRRRDQEKDKNQGKSGCGHRCARGSQSLRGPSLASSWDREAEEGTNFIR